MIACWEDLIDICTARKEELISRMKRGKPRKGQHRPKPTIYTLERLFGEVEEAYTEVGKLREKLKAKRLGSKASIDLLPEIWTELGVLELKAKYAAQGVDDFLEDSKA
jgi:hypothetical protein